MFNVRASLPFPSITLPVFIRANDPTSHLTMSSSFAILLNLLITQRIAGSCPPWQLKSRLKWGMANRSSRPSVASSEKSISRGTWWNCATDATLKTLRKRRNARSRKLACARSLNVCKSAAWHNDRKVHSASEISSQSKSRGKNRSLRVLEAHINGA